MNPEGDLWSFFILDAAKEVHRVVYPLPRFPWDFPGNQPITVPELRVAKKKILMCIQKETFSQELNDLSSKNNNCVKKSSSLFKLDPILKESLIRVGGQTNKAPITQDAKIQSWT
jgi:hypothetical protein